MTKWLSAKIIFFHKKRKQYTRKRQFIRTKLNNFSLARQKKEKIEHFHCNWPSCEPKALSRIFIGQRYGAFRNSINRTTWRYFFYFCQGDEIFSTTSFSSSTYLIRSLNPVISLLIFIESFRLIGLISALVLARTSFVRVPIFHPSFGLGEKKRREISCNRDYELTLVEILKVSWGTSIVPPEQLLGIGASCRGETLHAPFYRALTTYPAEGTEVSLWNREINFFSMTQ